MKNHITIMIAVFVALGGILLLAGCDKPSNAADNPPAAKAQTKAETKAEPQAAADAKTAAAPDKIVAYYFHGNRRCKTCLGIQSTIEKTVQTHFADATKEGLLQFMSINTDQDENKHFSDDFNLAFSSLVLVAKAGEETVKWENCGKVWEHAHDHPALEDYVRQRIEAFLLMLGSK